MRPAGPSAGSIDFCSNMRLNGYCRSGKKIQWSSSRRSCFRTRNTRARSRRRSARDVARADLGVAGEHQAAPGRGSGSTRSSVSQGRRSTAPSRHDLDRGDARPVALQALRGRAGEHAAARRRGSPRPAAPGTRRSRRAGSRRRARRRPRVVSLSFSSRRISSAAPPEGMRARARSAESCFGIAPHLPGQRLEDELVHAAAEALEDVVLVGLRLAPPDDAARDRARVAKPEPRRAHGPQQRQQVAEAAAGSRGSGRAGGCGSSSCARSGGRRAGRGSRPGCRAPPSTACAGRGRG